MGGRYMKRPIYAIKAIQIVFWDYQVGGAGVGE
jgi:hypothetical protein